MQQQKYESVDNTTGEALYQRYGPTLFATLLRQTASREDAEDLLVEVFLAVLQHPALQIASEQEQRAWLWRVAHNKVVDHFRRFSRYSSVNLEQIEAMVYSYATKDGKQNWSHPLTSWVQDLTIVAGRIYFGTFDYNVYALRATDGIEVWHQNIGGHVRKVLIASGVLYAQEDGNYGPTQTTSTVDAALFAFKTADGTQLWSQKTTAYVSLKAVANGVLYATDFPRQLTAFSATTGAELWHQLYGTDLIDKMGGHSGRVTAITVVS